MCKLKTILTIINQIIQIKKLIKSFKQTNKLFNQSKSTKLFKIIQGNHMLEQQKVQLEDNLARYNNYRSLWRAVVLQALLDIKSNSNNDMTNVNKAKAILWINLNKKDFLDVCHRAELNPKQIYETKLRILGQQKSHKK